MVNEKETDVELKRLKKLLEENHICPYCGNRLNEPSKWPTYIEPDYFPCAITWTPVLGTI